MVGNVTSMRECTDGLEVLEKIKRGCVYSIGLKVMELSV